MSLAKPNSSECRSTASSSHLRGIQPRSESNSVATHHEMASPERGPSVEVFSILEKFRAQQKGKKLFSREEVGLFWPA